MTNRDFADGRDVELRNARPTRRGSAIGSLARRLSLSLRSRHRRPMCPL